MTEQNDHGAGGEMADATPEERAEAERLRAELDSLDRDVALLRPSDDARLASELRAAYTPRAIEDGAHDALVGKVLGRAKAKDRHRTRRQIITFAAACAAAAAAAIIYRAPRPVDEDGERSLPEMRVARSAAPMLGARDTLRAGTAARVDRIAMARRDDWRQNRYATWGVR